MLGEKKQKQGVEVPEAEEGGWACTREVAVAGHGQSCQGPESDARREGTSLLTQQAIVEHLPDAGNRAAAECWLRDAHRLHTGRVGVPRHRLEGRPVASVTWAYFQKRRPPVRGGPAAEFRDVSKKTGKTSPQSPRGRALLRTAGPAPSCGGREPASLLRGSSASVAGLRGSGEACGGGWERPISSPSPFRLAPP